MDSLFGVPTGTLTLVVLAVFVAGALVLVFLAARDRTSFRMAVRNVPRRRAQTGLIVAGLTLATVLFSAAFTTGDTLTNWLRVQALEDVGRVNVVVRAEQPDPGGGVPFGPGAGVAQVPQTREKYFDAGLAEVVRDRLSGMANVAGVAPLAKESAPVTAPKTDLSEPRVDVLGMDAGSMGDFDRLTTASGKTLPVDGLGKDEVYVSRETAEGLGVGVGDTIEAPLAVSAAEPARAAPEPRNGRRAGASQGSPRGASGGAQAGNPPAGFGSESRSAGQENRSRDAGTTGSRVPPNWR